MGRAVAITLTDQKRRELRARAGKLTLAYVGGEGYDKANEEFWTANADAGARRIATAATASPGRPGAGHHLQQPADHRRAPRW